MIIASNKYGNSCPLPSCRYNVSSYYDSIDSGLSPARELYWTDGVREDGVNLLMENFGFTRAFAEIMWGNMCESL